MDNTSTNPVYKIITLVIGVVLIAGIGFYVLKNKSASVKDTPKTAEENVPVVATTTLLHDLNAGLSEDEKMVLNVDAKKLTREEGEARFALAQKMAVEGKEINLNNCVAKPLVLKVKNGTTITIFNNSIRDTTFGFGEESVIVPASGKATYKINFKTGQGLYGYGCDNKEVPRAAGLILVTP